MSWPIVVVGAGISGLAVTEALVARGREVRLLEAAPHAGGMMHTEEVDGYLLESGPNAFLDREVHVRELVHRLGLQMALRPAAPAANRRYVYTRGAMRPLPASPPAFLTSDVLRLSGRLRALLEPLSRRGPRGGADEALGPFMRRHLGDEATAVLVDAAQIGTWAGDLERLSVRAAFPRLWELEQRHRSLLVGLWRSRRDQKALPGAGGTPSGRLTTFEGGLQTLVNALVARIGPRLRTRTPVVGLARAGSGWRVQLESDRALDAEHVILTTPAYESARLLRPLAPALADGLDAIPYAPIAAVHLGFAPGAAPPLSGFGFLVPHREGRAILGTIYASSSFPFRAPRGATLLTTLLGGARRPELVELPEEALIVHVQRELGQMLDLRSEPALARAVRWTRGIPQYEVGHLERAARLHAAAAALGPLSLSGNAFDGVGIADCVRNAGRLADSLAD